VGQGVGGLSLIAGHTPGEGGGQGQGSYQEKGEVDEGCAQEASGSEARRGC